MRLCVNSKAMQVKVQREKESHNRTIVTKVEQWKKIVTIILDCRRSAIELHIGYTFSTASAATVICCISLHILCSTRLHRWPWVCWCIQHTMNDSPHLTYTEKHWHGWNDEYCTISNCLAIMHHRACGCGRNQSFVPGHSQSGWRSNFTVNLAVNPSWDFFFK